VYYSGFSPFPEADLRLPLKPAPLMREHRLYQSDWLMRFYGFEMSELTSEANPSLSLTEDPKTTWAKSHPEFFPVDVNAAPREALLRIPGIGYGTVRRILSIRRYHSLVLEDLRKLNVRLKQALPYLVTPDHLPGKSLQQDSGTKPAQLDLFAGEGALTGSL
jgi:predicted DNA-binding helix-hairpin-helix protein